MYDELSIELSKGKILDDYVKEFLREFGYKDGIEILEFSNYLIREVEDILFALDAQNREPVELLNDLQSLLDKFVRDNLLNISNLEDEIKLDNREKLLKTLYTLVYDEKQWVSYNIGSNKLVSNIRRCILKVLSAITEFQNNQMADMDNLIEAMNDKYPIRQGGTNNQVFLSHAYIDRLYTLGLFLYFYGRNIYLYIDWMHQPSGQLTKKIKNNLLIAIDNSKQILFLRSLNSELGLQGGNRQIREWCAWEIGIFDYKSHGTGDKYFIDRYRRNKKSKSRSQLIQDFLPFSYVQNGRLC